MKIDKVKIIDIVNTSKSMAEAARKLGINYKTLRKYAKKLGMFKTNQSGRGIVKYKVDLQDILSNEVKFSTAQLKKRLIEEKILENKCCKCGNEGMWINEPLSLELHHINGDDNDNRLENLQILCPNCHTQTNNYRRKGNNKKVKSDYTKQIVLKKFEKLIVGTNDLSIDFLSTGRKRKECFCPQCGGKFSGKGKTCNKCSKINKRKIERPSYEQLLREIEKTNYCEVGRKYGVSDNTIRKWKKNYEKNLKT